MIRRIALVVTGVLAAGFVAAGPAAAAQVQPPPPSPSPGSGVTSEDVADIIEKLREDIRESNDKANENVQDTVAGLRADNLSDVTAANTAIAAL